MNLTDNLFVGKLVRFAAPKPDDHAAMAKWTDNPEYWRMLDTDPARPQNADYWADRDKEMKESQHNSFNFRIRTLEDDKLIGFFWIFARWQHQVCTVAIGIGEPEYWGRGYGADAMQLGVNYAFRELNLYKVGLSVFSYNTRAIRSYEKAGFVHETRLRAMAFRDGERHDWIEMGMLRSEWEARLNA
jgi:RimJ/RimL family protein N-acetyltransferase